MRPRGPSSASSVHESPAVTHTWTVAIAGFVVEAHRVTRLGRLLFLRDFRLRYRQTYFGYLWAVIKVLAPSVPMILVGAQFGLGGERSASGYALYALVGVVLWQVFWDSVLFPQWVARRMRRMLSEALFPYEAILCAATGYVLFNAGLYLMVVIAATAVLGGGIPATVPLGLISIPGLIMSGLAIGMVFVPFTFVYLDFRYALPMASPVLLWTAPIFYESPDSGLVHILNVWNPLTYLIGIPRSWLTEGVTGNDGAFLVSLVVFGLIFLPAHFFFRRAIPIGVERLTHG
jgi:lipopolysaccharide transport system permease protein